MYAEDYEGWFPSNWDATAGSTGSLSYHPSPYAYGTLRNGNYIKNWKLHVCPSRRYPAKETSALQGYSSYIYLGRLNEGRNYTSNKVGYYQYASRTTSPNPSTTVLMADTTAYVNYTGGIGYWTHPHGWKLFYEKDKGTVRCNELFADGHVASCSYFELKQKTSSAYWW